MHQFVLVAVIKRLRNLLENLNQIALGQLISVDVDVFEQVHLHKLCHEENEVAVHKQVHESEYVLMFEAFQNLDFTEDLLNVAVLV